MIPAITFALQLIVAATETPPPPGLDLSQQRLTDHGIFRVSIKSLSNPIVIKQIHSWNIHINIPNGAAVAGANIDVDGGMPQHGHGFPTQPRVTKDLGGGDYLLEGVKFSMSGWWVMELKIHSPQGDDTVTFNIVISLPRAWNSAIRSIEVDRT